MPPRVRDVWPGGRTARRAWPLLLAAGVAAAVVAGLVVVRLGGPAAPDPPPTGGGQPPSAAGGPQPPADAGPTDSTPGGVPIGYPHTPRGAVAAAGQYLASITGHERFFDDAARSQELAAVAAPEALARLEADYAAAAESIRAALGLDALSDDAQLLAHTSPVRYTLLDYSDATATVQVWAVLVLGTSPAAAQRPPLASWTTTTVTLAWVGGDWKLASTDARVGPSPPTDPTAPAASAAEFAQLLATSQPFRHAPQP